MVYVFLRVISCKQEEIDSITALEKQIYQMNKATTQLSYDTWDIVLVWKRKHKKED